MNTNTKIILGSVVGALLILAVIGVAVVGGLFVSGSKVENTFGKPVPTESP